MSDNSWKVVRRYNDFVQLDIQLKISGIKLQLPPKRYFGNTERDFIAKRQQLLEVCLDSYFCLKIYILSLNFLNILKHTIQNFGK